ncbi:hypothetical protein U0070_019273, partial [Myodes glareolus]
MDASGCQSECPQLGYWGAGGGYYYVLVVGSQKELAESKTSSIFRKVTFPICHQKVLKPRRENTLRKNKEECVGYARNRLPR